MNTNKLKKGLDLCKVIDKENYQITRNGYMYYKKIKGIDTVFVSYVIYHVDCIDEYYEYSLNFYKENPLKERSIEGIEIVILDK